MSNKEQKENTGIFVEITPSRKESFKIWFKDNESYEQALTQFKNLHKINACFIEIDGYLLGIDFLKDCKIDLV